MRRLVKKNEKTASESSGVIVYAHEFVIAASDNTNVNTPELNPPTLYDARLHDNAANAVVLQALGAAGVGWTGGPLTATAAGLVGAITGVQSQCLSCHL